MNYGVFPEHDVGGCPVPTPLKGCDGESLTGLARGKARRAFTG